MTTRGNGTKAPKPGARGLKPTFSPLLTHMIRADRLDIGQLPSIRRYGGRSISLVAGPRSPDITGITTDLSQTTLVSIRNSLAHGDPFDGYPWAGLLELVRDLIEYAYKGLIADRVGMPSSGDLKPNKQSTCP